MEIYKWRHQIAEKPKDMTVKEKVDKFLETSQMGEDEEEEIVTRVMRTPTPEENENDEVRKRNVKLPA